MTLDFLYIGTWNKMVLIFCIEMNFSKQIFSWAAKEKECIDALKLPILSFIFPLLILWTNSNDKFTYWILVQQFYQVYYRPCDTDRDTMKWRKC